MTITSDTGIWEIGVNWPWPQMIFTSYYNLAVAQKADGKLALYEMTNTNNTWTAVEKIVLGKALNVVSLSIADFSNYYILAVEEYINGNKDHNLYGKNVITNEVTLIDTTLPAATTCCNYQGQLVLGGLFSGKSPWQELSSCSVAWSDIGSNNMNPENFVAAGFALMPWDENGNGAVWKVLVLGNKIRVYGDRGNCSLIPFSLGRNTGFGISEIETPGLFSSDTIAGDEFVHGFVDSNYDWNLVTEEKTSNLGYRNFLETLTNQIVVRYDSHNKRFYISDGILCFVYSKYGMYSTHQCVSSIGNYKGILTGFFKDNTDTKIRLKTTSFDFGQQGEQTIESIECGLTYNTTSGNAVTGGIDANYNYADDFISLPYTQLNPRGIFTQKVTAREFKIKLLGTYESGKEFSLSLLKANLKFSDKRNIRGRLNVN